MVNSREERLQYLKHFERAQGWLALGKVKEATGALSEIPAGWQVRPEVLGLRVQVHLMAEEWAEAVMLAEKLTKLEPLDPQHWISLAFATRRLVGIGEAERILTHARGRFPDVALIWYNLACYASQQDRQPEAGNLLERAVALEAPIEILARKDEDLAPYWKWKEKPEA